jgi:hypothetical protein
MTRSLLRSTLLLGAALLALCAFAASASARNFYVNQRSGENSTLCGFLPAPNLAGEGPCLTIKRGIERSEGYSGPNSIRIAEGTYDESLTLSSVRDAGIAIEAEELGTVTLNSSGSDAVSIGSAAGQVTIGDMKIISGGGAPQTIFDNNAGLTLTHDQLETDGGLDGVYASTTQQVSILDTELMTEEGTSGSAVRIVNAPLTMENDRVLTGQASQSQSGGVIALTSPDVVVRNTRIADDSELSATSYALGLRLDPKTLIENVAIQQGSAVSGVYALESNLDANGLRVEMADSSSGATALLDEMSTESTSLGHLEILGTWRGPGLKAAGTTTLTDSRIVTAGTSVPAIAYADSGSGRGLLVQRSVLRASPVATSAVALEDGNATFDSAAVFGGHVGVEDVLAPNASGATHSLLTLSASTVDAGAPGIAGDGAGVDAVRAVAENGPENDLSVNVQGSILLEPLSVVHDGGNTASARCSYSAVPSQVQGAGESNGTIACPDGADGNTAVSTGLFATGLASFEPITNYELAPGTSAVDSVPQSALSLPFGIGRSGTDLVGAPRVVDGRRDCRPVQDKGALELQSQTVPCISSLRVRPRSLRPATHGASLIRRGRGVHLSWHDSEAATVTFTVLRPVAGRLKGRTCERLSRSNASHRHCQDYVALGSFKHRDGAGANSAIFTGRVGGHALARGRYELQALARNGRGHGVKVLVAVTIR